VLFFTAATYFLLRRILGSSFGRALLGIKVNEHRMRALGFPVFRYQLASFALAGGLAGLAGYLAAVQFGFVNPEILSWHQSGAVLMMVILGGMGTLHGAVIGAFAFVLLQEVLSNQAWFGVAAKHWQLAMGILIMLVALYLPQGLAGLMDRSFAAGRRWRPRRAPMAEAILRTEGLTKRFGGLVAVSDVSLDLHVGEVHVVIGPNGAGKSTLTNLLSGDLPATSGRVMLDGRDIAGLSSDQISRMGVGRSYQKTNIFLPFTVFENARLAAQSRTPYALRVFSRRRSSTRDQPRWPGEALESAGLAHRAQRVAATLSHGEQRQLEIAMCLATQPRVLLLDEPLAGMGPHESQRMVELIGKLRADHAIMLIEHDMDAVFALANRLTVMVNGEVLETGSPEQVRSSPAVQAAYLGGEELLHE
jgi:branched-chain amino acid transport system permease protein